MLCDGEDQQEALSAAEVVVSDGGVVLLTRRVQDINLNVLAVQDHLLPVAVGLGGLVVLHKLRTYEMMT